MALFRRTLAVACFTALTAVDSVRAPRNVRASGPARIARRRFVRYAAPVVLGIVIAAVDAGAFDLDVHVEITRAALAGVRETLQRASNEMLGRGFTEVAQQEIALANRAIDTGDCGGNGEDDNPAKPCNNVNGSEELTALVRLLEKKAPEYEHFDEETFQAGNSRIFNARSKIRTHLQNKRFIAARQELGGALHTIQDFYAHTNWVELGYTQPLKTLGMEQNAFAPGSKPRLADVNEPTCVGGARLLSDLTQEEWIKRDRDDNDVNGDHGLLTRYQMAEEQGLATGPITSVMLLRAWNDPPLTSGHFFIWGDPAPPTQKDLLTWENLTALVGSNYNTDPPAVTERGKCRHGYFRGLETIRVGTTTYGFGASYQPGIAKDVLNKQTSPWFGTAQRIAAEASGNFIVSLFNDRELRDRPDFLELMLGFMGYEPVAWLESFRIGIPRAPGDRFWDDNLGSYLLIRSVLPDISVCIEPSGGRMICAPVCDNADYSDEIKGYACGHNMRVPAGPIRVLVREVDVINPIRVVADFRVDDPAKCSISAYRSSAGRPAPAAPRDNLPVATPGDAVCSLELEPGRTVFLQFAPSGATAAGSGGGPAPPGPGVPPAPGSSPPASGSPPAAYGPPAPTAPGPQPGAPGSGPAAAIARAAPGGGNAARRVYTPADIDVALALRDQDNCVGPDTFYPAGTALTGSALGRQLGPDQTNRVYQMAAFAMSIANQPARQAVLEPDAIARGRRCLLWRDDARHQRRHPVPGGGGGRSEHGQGLCQPARLDGAGSTAADSQTAGCARARCGDLDTQAADRPARVASARHDVSRRRHYHGGMCAEPARERGVHRSRDRAVR